MSEYRIEVRLKNADAESAQQTHEPLVKWGDIINAQTAADKIKVAVGPLVEIETCQLYGVKDGRQVDLGDIPLTPELKAREIVRQYGLGDPDDEWSEASTMLGAMQEMINWLKQQGRLK